ncbi:MAG: hypothetical protein QNJ94_22305 [Alphaproteobacteria bacterium]|nr:hypothetical protein [Alphaproteobacteria bacterium]
MPKALPGNLDVVFTGRWSSRYVYGTDHPPAAVEAENYFLPLTSFFVGADGAWTPARIEVVVRTAGAGYLVAEFVVAFASAQTVRVDRVIDWRAVGQVDLTAVPDGPGRFTVTDGDGKILAQGVRENRARRMGAALPKEAPAQPAI